MMTKIPPPSKQLCRVVPTEKKITCQKHLIAYYFTSNESFFIDVRL